MAELGYAHYAPPIFTAPATLASSAINEIIAKIATQNAPSMAGECSKSKCVRIMSVEVPFQFSLINLPLGITGRVTELLV